MINLTSTEAMLIEEVLQEMLILAENEDIVEDTQELHEALEIIRSCNTYSEEEMITLEEGYTEEAVDEEHLNYK